MRHRKYISLLLLVILVTSNLGWSITTQYCDGKYKNTVVALLDRTEDSKCTKDKNAKTCCKPEQDKSGDLSYDCCTNQITHTKTDHSSITELHHLGFTMLSVENTWRPVIEFYRIRASKPNQNTTKNTSISNIELFKLYCKYQLYG